MQDTQLSFGCLQPPSSTQSHSQDSIACIPVLHIRCGMCMGGYWLCMYIRHWWKICTLIATCKDYGLFSVCVASLNLHQEMARGKMISVPSWDWYLWPAGCLGSVLLLIDIPFLLLISPYGWKGCCAGFSRVCLSCCNNMFWCLY